MRRRTAVAHPEPTKAFLMLNPETAMLSTPIRCTHPPPPIPPPNNIARSDITKWNFHARYTAFFQVLATYGCHSINHVHQSESRIQILLQFNWMTRFSVLYLDIATTWKNAVSGYILERVNSLLRSGILIGSKYGLHLWDVHIHWSPHAGGHWDATEVITAWLN